eukprot:4443877-Amphidinium_carterae.1
MAAKGMRLHMRLHTWRTHVCPSAEKRVPVLSVARLSTLSDQMLLSYVALEDAESEEPDNDETDVSPAASPNAPHVDTFENEIMVVSQFTQTKHKPLIFTITRTHSVRPVVVCLQ